MDPFQDNTDDARAQPWKDWVREELEARKKAEETDEGRNAQEERAQAFLRKKKDEEDDEEGYDSPGNKAG